MFQQLIVENRYEKYATPMPAAFLHRMLIPFGVRVLDASRHFDVAGIDVAAIALLLLGAAGLMRAIFDFRDGGQGIYMAALQIANLAFVAWMKFVYNYHLLLVALLMIPFAARAIERVRARRVIIAVVLLGWCVNLFASVLRGKEHDRAYQDLVMREAHARTAPDETFFAGVPWAIHREPAYRLWFLPELARVMVRRGFAERFHIRHVVDHAPAVVVFDYNVLFWMAAVQPELGAYFTRHYVPVWRNLWVPGMNAAIARGARFEWIVPKDGTYRLYVSARLAGHPWFHEALRAASYSGPGLERLTFSLPDASGAGVEWRVDDAPLDGGASLDLKRGQRLTVINRGGPAAVLAIPGDDRVLMRQPPQNVTIEAEHGRVTHVPRVGLRLQP
jgi:hypothetical protein